MRFSALGSIMVDGVAPGAPQVRRLLAELLVCRNRGVTQEVLIDALWDGSPPPAAISAFQSKVSRLRRLLQPHELRSTPSGYMLTVADDQFDAAQFERLAAGGTEPRTIALACRHALELWHGNAYGSAASDPLVEPVAQRLEMLRHRTMQREVDALVALGELDTALLRATALISEDEYAEPPRAALIRCLALTGRKVDALRAYAEFRRVLGEETGLSPTPELQQLEHDVLNDRLDRATVAPSAAVAAVSAASGSSSSWLTVPTPSHTFRGSIASSGQMVGRSSLSSALRGWLAVAGDGVPASVALVGDAGSGKTIALHELKRECRRIDCTVRILRSRAVTQPLFLPLLSSTDLDNALDGDATSTTPTSPERSMSAMLVRAHTLAAAIIDEARERGPLAVAFDDLHLADAGTVEVAAALVDAIGSTSQPTCLLVVITARPPRPGSELDQLLERMAREPTHHHWVLQPLGEPSVHALVRSRSGMDPTPSLTAALHRAGGGNPYATVALLRTLLDGGHLEADGDGRLHANPLAVATAPAALRTRVDERVAALSSNARAVLAALSLVDGGVDDVRAVSGVDAAEFVAAVDEISTTLALKTFGSDHWAEAHDLTREEWRASLTESERQATHRRALEHFRPAAATDAAAAAQFLDHAGRAAALDDPDLVAAAQRVAEAASATMRWADAAYAFDLVAERHSELDAHLQAGIAHFRNHDTVACRRHLTIAREGALVHGAVREEATAAITLQRAELSLVSGRSRFDPQALIDGAARWHESAPDLAAQALALAAEGAFHRGDHEGGLALTDRAASYQVAGADDHVTAASVAFARGLCLLGTLDLVSATASFETALGHAEAADDAWRQAWALGRLALVWLHRGDAHESLRWCRRARQIERSTNNWSELAVVETIAASAIAATGDVETALDVAHDALALTRRSSYTWTRLPSMSVLLFCAVQRHDVSHAKAILDDMAADAGDRAVARWAELAGLQLAGLRRHHAAPPVLPADEAASAEPADIRRLTSLALRGAIHNRRGEPVSAALHAAAAAGVRFTLGWPFDLLVLTS